MARCRWCGRAATSLGTGYCNWHFSEEVAFRVERDAFRERLFMSLPRWEWCETVADLNNDPTPMVWWEFSGLPVHLL